MSFNAIMNIPGLLSHVRMIRRSPLSASHFRHRLAAFSTSLSPPTTTTTTGAADDEPSNSSIYNDESSKHAADAAEKEFLLGVKTGKVKRYSRSKFYGHIQMDNAPKDTPAIFCHRSGIQSELNLEKFPQMPFLKPLERVQFTLEKVEPPVKNKNSPYKAVNITFADGRPIPPLRPTFFVGRRDYAKKVSFEKIGLAVDNGKELTQEEKLELFEESYATYKSLMDEAKDLITQVGMNFDDFPRVLKTKDKDENKLPVAAFAFKDENNQSPAKNVESSSIDKDENKQSLAENVESSSIDKDEKKPSPAENVTRKWV